MNTAFTSGETSTEQNESLFSAAICTCDVHNNNNFKSELQKKSEESLRLVLPKNPNPGSKGRLRLSRTVK